MDIYIDQNGTVCAFFSERQKQDLKHILLPMAGKKCRAWTPDVNNIFGGIVSIADALPDQTV
jgi:hypothetical protein